MIECRTVITMRIPFSDDINLATQAHMYICRDVIGNKYSFVKCQTLKPYMLFNTPVKNYIDEPADIMRNPFRSTTRIDCDKIFRTYNVEYSDDLITDIRPDICSELFNHILRKFSENEYRLVKLDESCLTILNKKIIFVKDDIL